MKQINENQKEKEQQRKRKPWSVWMNTILLMLNFSLIISLVGYIREAKLRRAFDLQGVTELELKVQELEQNAEARKEAQKQVSNLVSLNGIKLDQTRDFVLMLKDDVLALIQEREARLGPPEYHPRGYIP